MLSQKSAPCTSHKVVVAGFVGRLVRLLQLLPTYNDDYQLDYLRRIHDENVLLVRAKSRMIFIFLRCLEIRRRHFRSTIACDFLERLFKFSQVEELNYICDLADCTVALFVPLK